MKKFLVLSLAALMLGSLGACAPTQKQAPAPDTNKEKVVAEGKTHDETPVEGEVVTKYKIEGKK